MFTQRKKILTFLAVFLIAVLLLAVFFYYRMINNKKPQKDQTEEQTSLNTTVKVPDYVKPVAEDGEYYDSFEVTYDLIGIIKEKGEGWVLIEDQTPQPSDKEKETSELKKIIVSDETKIAKDKRLIDFQEIKADDQALFKVQQEGENISATDLLIIPL